MHCVYFHALWAVAFLGISTSLSAHEHLTAGVVDLNGNGYGDPGERLQLLEGGVSGRTFHMVRDPSATRYVGYYSLTEVPRDEYPLDYFTFQAYSHTTDPLDIKYPGRTAIGSRIWMEIARVEGPAGAHFGFWEENRSFEANEPTVEFLTNTSTGAYRFPISEGEDAAGEDPGGHIHNRGWTVDRPGDYYVTFKLYDISTNRPGGQPYHLPSQDYVFHFQAVPEPASAELLLIGAGMLTTRRRGHARR